MTPILIQRSTKTSDIDAIRLVLLERYPLQQTDHLLQNNILVNESVNPFEPVTISDVRNLPTLLQHRPYKGEIRIVTLAQLDKSSLPAQNALLKILEEPPSQTLFLITSQQTNLILETIHSRCQICFVTDQPVTDSESSQLTKAAATFYQQIQSGQPTYGHLIEQAALYKEKSAAHEFLNELLSVIHQHHLHTPTPQSTRHLKAVQQALQDISLNVNSSLALEHCFFMLKLH